MSANPEVQEVHPIIGVVTPLEEPSAMPEPSPRKPRPAALVPAAVAAAGLLVAGTLGYLLYSTTVQRDTVRHQLSTTQTSLVSARGELSSAKTDAASKKAVADYVALYVAGEAKIQTDYFETVNCADYSTCRTAAQQMLSDMQQFQADRAAATVPSALISSDNSLGDAISAAIAGDQEFITGMDNNDDSKIKEGGSKIDAAMLNVAKAEAALGSALQ